MIATIYIFLFFPCLGKTLPLLSKSLVLSHGHHFLSHPWDPSLCQLQCPASCWVLEWSLGECLFFFLLILLPALFAWEVKAARKESHCLLLPPNQTLLSYWHDGVLLRKNSLLFISFWVFIALKKIKNKNPSFFLNPCSLLWWLKWVSCLQLENELQTNIWVTF